MPSDLRDLLKRTAMNPAGSPDLHAIAARGRRLRGQRIAFLGMAASVVLALAIASASALQGQPPMPGEVTGSPSPEPSPLEPEEREVLLTEDGWTVTVAVEPRRLGLLEVSAIHLGPAPKNNSHPWVQVDLRFLNRSSEDITFGDTRTSRFLPGDVHPRLIVADVGCGYGFAEPEGAVEAGACASYLDIPTLRAGGTLRREVTLFHGLEGMEPLEEGTYVFVKKVEFAVGAAEPQTYSLRVVYGISHNLCMDDGDGACGKAEDPKPEPSLTTEEFRSEPAGDGRYRVWPRSEDIANEGTYRFSAPHCGLDWMVDFDGSFWHAEKPDDYTGRDYPFFFNSDVGTIFFVGDDDAVYTASTGEEIDLRRLPGSIVSFGCD